MDKSQMLESVRNYLSQFGKASAEKFCKPSLPSHCISAKINNQTFSASDEKILKAMDEVDRKKGI